MWNPRKVSVLLALTVTSAGAAAQAPSPSNQNVFTPSALVRSAESVPFQAAGASRKDPAVAGILSLLIPGVGSYYAGNNTHGTVHLGIHVLSYALIVGSAVDCLESFSSDCSGQATGVTVGYLALLTNGVWSIFTAVHDARATNAKGATPGRVVGSLYVDPAVVRVGSSSNYNAIQLFSIHK